MNDFKLDPKLENDLIELGDLKLSKVLLMPDSENPWLVLVPRLFNITELYQIDMDQQHILLDEINFTSKGLTTLFQPTKLNIGALGNMVPQLHIHIICRYQDDRAWPNSLWGTSSKEDKNKLAFYKKKLIEKLF